MSEKTVKAFNTLHEKMLESNRYRTGYQTGLRHVRAFLKMSINELRAVRRWYLHTHNSFAAGLARAIHEVIWSKLRKGGEAA